MIRQRAVAAAVTAAVAPGTERVVHREPGAKLHRVTGERQAHRQRRHEVRRVRGQDAPLGQGLAHEPDLAVREIAQAAVDLARRLARRARREIAALEKRHAEPARRRVEGNPRTADPAADHDDVELLLAQPLDDVVA